MLCKKRKLRRRQHVLLKVYLKRIYEVSEEQKKSSTKRKQIFR